METQNKTRQMKIEIEIKIQVPNLCTQPWDEMTPEAGGRHCISCAKTVTDFTRMTDAQILEVLRNNAGGCGRFRKDQLERELIAPSASRRFSFATFYKLVASLLLVFSAGKIAAQERKEIPTEETPLKISRDTSSYISGFVTDEKGEPLTGAKIEVDNYVTQVASYFRYCSKAKAIVNRATLSINPFVLVA